MSTEPPRRPSDHHNEPRPPLQSPQRKSFSPFNIAYFTDPVSLTFSGISRRLSLDEPLTPLARALSANHSGAMQDPTNGVYHAPVVKRRLSPFQPPPLTPLALHGYRDSTRGRSRLLSKSLAEEIRLLVPPRLQLVETWRLGYSLEQDGSTLNTLYAKCGEHRGSRGGYVLVVRDGEGRVFGAYLSDPPRPQPHYYGSGECFLWQAVKLPALPDLSNLPPPPSEDTTHLQRMTTIAASKNSSTTSLASLNPKSNGNGDLRVPEQIRFKAFPYTGENDFSIYCEADYLSVGGGDGRYGLWLDQKLSKGVSERCPTFGNEGLSAEGKKFGVLGVEVWYIGS